MNCEWLEGLFYSKKSQVWLSDAFMERVCWLFLLNPVTPLGELCQEEADALETRRSGRWDGIGDGCRAELLIVSWWCPNLFFRSREKLSPCSESFFVGGRLKAGGS